MGRDFSKRRFDQDFIKCLATLESLARSRRNLSTNFGENNSKILNSVVESHTASLKHIITMGAHIITHTEFDSVIELSTAFGKLAYKHFGDLLLAVVDSWKLAFDKDLEAASDREAYLTSMVEYWTSVQSRLDEKIYITSDLHLDNLIEDALLQLHYEAQAIEQDSYYTLHAANEVPKDGAGASSILKANGADDAKDGVMNEG